LEDFFLAANPSKQDEEFIGPVRSGSSIKGLIDGVAAFSAMEKAIEEAKNHVFISMWVFDPELQLQNPHLSRLKNWGGLLQTKAAEGKQVKIILADFDPIQALDLHGGAWKAYRQLLDLQIGLPKRISNNLQFFCSRHNAKRTRGTGELQKRKLAEILRSLNHKDNLRKACQILSNSPGLWEWISLRSDISKRENGPFSLRKDEPPPLFVASHHQKLIVVDGKIGFCGGLDPKIGRVDTPDHTNMLWHDVMCQIEGSVVNDIESTFAARWNRESEGYTKFLSKANSMLKADRNNAKHDHHLPCMMTSIRILKLDHVSGPSHNSPPSVDKGKSSAQILRTLSRDAFFGHKTVRDDIRRIYVKAISKAKEFIYIENQYFRSVQVAKSIIERSSRVPSLQTIIVLPVGPEEANRRGGPDPVTLHGMHLSYEVVKLLQDSLKGRIAFFNPITKSPRMGKAQMTDIKGHKQIYVHSKVMIIDDIWSTVGSANTNGRSFELDTEMNIAWFEKESVKNIRLALWQELLGLDHPTITSWTSSNFLKSWQQIANRNEKLLGTKLQGYIVPYNNEKLVGKRNSFIPDEYT
jgi:phospholipase D1/2